MVDYLKRIWITIAAKNKDYIHSIASINVILGIKKQTVKSPFGLRIWINVAFDFCKSLNTIFNQFSKQYRCKWALVKLIRNYSIVYSVFNQLWLV